MQDNEQQDTTSTREELNRIELKRLLETQARFSQNSEQKTSVAISAREALLDTAREVVTQDRRKTYGSAEDNFRNIANLWNTQFRTDIFTPGMVAQAMILVKLARLQETPGHFDSWVDIAGYAACGYEANNGS